MSLWPVTSATLLSDIRDTDDQSAWDRFARAYRPAVFRFARRLGLQHADADDIAQRVLESVSRAFRERPPDLRRGRFRSWIATITRNAAINLVQRDLRIRGSGRSSVVQKLEQLADISEQETMQLWLQEERTLLYRTAAAEVRANCTETVWSAFEMTAVHGHSISVASQKLGVPVGMIYAARSRVLKRIRAVVQRHQNESTEGDS